MRAGLGLSKIGMDMRAWVIKRDAPVGSVDTYPNCRHQPIGLANIVSWNQMVTRQLSVLHNHPSGDPTPSKADIEMTRDIAKAALALGLTIHDHLVIGRKGHASFKSLNLL